ncbi:hypothetical protein CEXT_569461 [Caerostris extrusa]|uniref:Transmembrane protein n=1 Tax=Caerostris extrusa TaxID=172846 RepID=A0AAV4X1I5_CAEEX|nr:hypothetical protein CEXT_569461 [Caerostris extrusa]
MKFIIDLKKFVIPSNILPKKPFSTTSSSVTVSMGIEVVLVVLVVAMGVGVVLVTIGCGFGGSVVIIPPPSVQGESTISTANPQKVLKIPLYNLTAGGVVKYS